MSPTLLTILFALAVVIFLSSLPWLIGAPWIDASTAAASEQFRSQSGTLIS